VTPGEAVALAAQLRSPGSGAYDPTLHPDAAKRRFDEIGKELPWKPRRSTSGARPSPRPNWATSHHGVDREPEQPCGDTERDQDAVAEPSKHADAHGQR
jgi:hypothetical protein